MSEAGGPKAFFHNVSFSGNFGGEKVPMICPNCGPVLVSTPASGMMNSMTISNSSVDCPNCRQPIQVQMAHYEFQRKIFDTLADAKLSRQQARRFAKKAAKTKDQTALLLQSEAINPKLAEATKLAHQEKDRKSAILTVAAIATFIASTAGGVVAGDEIWDRWSKGELYESHTSENSESVKAEAAQKPKPEPNATHPNAKP